jgi:hypothetical protein
MPYLQETGFIISHQCLHFCQLVRRKTSGASEPNRFKPELGELAVPLHVDMGWLKALIAEEEETVGTDAFDGRGHLFRLPAGAGAA